MPSALLKTSAS